ncbi:MAG: YitT family protein, partial [Lachnospiraceae bacterium]|nr:YitT family protein [Lachnospiraceae bacterium]
IYSVAGAVFGLDRGMYSLLMYFITSKVIDIVEMGWDNTKSVMIITNDGNELAHKIYEGLGRTVTFLKGEGLVSKDTKDILYCVVTRAEIHDLKLLINSVEGSTFTTISDVSEIVGNHMKSREKKI